MAALALFPGGRMVLLHYYNDELNMGDLLSPWLVERISGRAPEYSEPKAGVLACVGSLLQRVVGGMEIWGAGVISASDKPSRRATYHAVRGPLSRKIVLARGGVCPEIYGDPVLLLPMFHQPAVQKKHRLGIVPHYVDLPAVTRTLRGEHFIIDVTQPDPIDTVNDILSCEAIVSSSLHGLIVAQAYGIPSALIGTIEGRLWGDGIKFRDYLLGTGQEPYAPLDPRGPLGGLPREVKLQFDPSRLLNACPVRQGKRLPQEGTLERPGSGAE